MNNAVQLKAHIRRLSKSLNVETEVLLRNFMMERLLERIANSEFKDNLVLKGGMLIASMVGLGSRSTMDMDALITGKTLSEEGVLSIIDEIIRIKLDDGTLFTIHGIESIQEGADYPGYRISIKASFDRIWQMIKLDITTGNEVVPKGIEHDFKLMFEDRTIQVKAYNLEMVLAEKFETIVTRGVANTRMRDYYDVYILTKLFPYNEEYFKIALGKTTEFRHSFEQVFGESLSTINHLLENVNMSNLWIKYQGKYSYATYVTWDMVIDSLRTLAFCLDRSELDESRFREIEIKK